MKFVIRKHLVETDHIKSAGRLATYSVKINFVSGYKLTVSCGVKSVNEAYWSEDADKFIAVLAKTGSPRLKQT